MLLLLATLALSFQWKLYDLWSRKTGPSAVVLTEVEAALEFTNMYDIAFFGFFEDVETKEAKAFLNVAETRDSLAFGITSSQEVADAMKASFDSIILYEKVRRRDLEAVCS